jgi:putative NADH-flavin reductase
MRIVVLGATGATGKELVKQALAAGHKVVAYVRRPDVVEQQPGLDIVAGQLEDVEAMMSAFQGSDAVICCVGPKLDLRTIRRVDLMQRSLPSIVTAMKGAGVDRLVLVSAFGVGDTAAKASPLARLIYRATMSGIYGDKARAESALPESGLNWTAVYPVILNDAPPSNVVTTQQLSAVDKVPGLPKVSRANVAAILIDLAADQHRSGERVLIS